MKRKVFILSLFIVLIDQLSKLLIIKSLVLNEGRMYLKNFFYFTYVQNTGAAWSILQGGRWFFIFLSLFMLFVIIKYFLLDINVKKIELIGYSLIIGGIIGNLIDRLFRGFVIDFIDLRFFNYQYPIFNLADSAMVIGVFLIIYHLITGVKR